MGRLPGPRVQQQHGPQLRRCRSAQIARSSDPAVLERGKHIAESIGACSSKDCHGGDFGGGEPIKMGPLGTMQAPNITAGGRGGEYSDAEFARLILHGVKRDGHGLTFMPAPDFAWWPDEDVVAVISVPAHGARRRAALGRDAARTAREGADRQNMIPDRRRAPHRPRAPAARADAGADRRLRRRSSPTPAAAATAHAVGRPHPRRAGRDGDPAEHHAARDGHRGLDLRGLRQAAVDRHPQERQDAGSDDAGRPSSASSIRPSATRSGRTCRRCRRSRSAGARRPDPSPLPSPRFAGRGRTVASRSVASRSPGPPLLRAAAVQRVEVVDEDVVADHLVEEVARRS